MPGQRCKASIIRYWRSKAAPVQNDKARLPNIDSIAARDGDKIVLTADDASNNKFVNSNDKLNLSSVQPSRYHFY